MGGWMGRKEEINYSMTVRSHSEKCTLYVDLEGRGKADTEKDKSKDTSSCLPRVK